MPMGAKCSAEVFQREMTMAMGDIDGMETVVDDILVHGKTQSEHDSRLIKVLERSRQLTLKLNREKSRIALKEVDYVGHRLTRKGLRPTAERVKAIANMKTPENVQELETVLGMVAYVAKFIPSLSNLCAPLREAKKSEEWY